MIILPPVTLKITLQTVAKHLRWIYHLQITSRPFKETFNDHKLTKFHRVIEDRKLSCDPTHTPCSRYCRPQLAKEGAAERDILVRHQQKHCQRRIVLCSPHLRLCHNGNRTVRTTVKDMPVSEEQC